MGGASEKGGKRGGGLQERVLYQRKLRRENVRARKGRGSFCSTGKKVFLPRVWEIGESKSPLLRRKKRKSLLTRRALYSIFYNGNMKLKQSAVLKKGKKKGKGSIRDIYKAALGRSVLTSLL